ncbi:MAG: heme ABC exporter ATP-binding protein CcmA [Pseudomonadota bacterium]
MELIIENLACRRAGRQVFQGLDFRVGAGAMAMLRGPNGVGKSTLLRALAGLLPIAEGHVRLGDCSLADDPAGFQEAVAYAGHLDAVKPALTVADNLALWCAVNGTPGDRARIALERFGLSPIAERMAAECSAGQKRRLGLARLLLTDRPLWLLDEPTVSLDHEAKALVADLVRDHLAGGGLALIASHEDLGLGNVAVLDMQPDAVTTREKTDDPFLEGAW